jgi:uncharacterized repeat protein (TIGR01451 family)
MSWVSRVVKIAALGAVLGLCPVRLAAQTQGCGAYSAVTSWSGSFTLTGQGSGNNSTYGYTGTSNQTLTSTKVLLIGYPSIPCYWYFSGAPDSSWSVSVNNTYDIGQGPQTVTASGAPFSSYAVIYIPASAVTFGAGAYANATDSGFNYPYAEVGPHDSSGNTNLSAVATISTASSPQELKGSVTFQASGWVSLLLTDIPMTWTLTYDLIPSVSPLSVTSLSPSTAAAGSGAFTLTVNGAGFVSGAGVQWNGTALATTFVSAAQLTASVTTDLLASQGTANVSVVEGGASIGTVPFTINPPGQNCTFSFSPLGAQFGAAGGASSVMVTASRSDCTWTATATSPWITFPNATFTGSATLNYNVAANAAGTSRTAAINVGLQSLPVQQGGTNCTYSLPTASQVFTIAGGAGTATVLAPPGCMWTAASGVPWIVVTVGSGSGDATVTYSVSPNSTAAARIGTLTIANQSYIVIQAGGASPTCTAAVAAPPQVALEGRTEVLGDYVLTCSGLNGTLTAELTLSLNVDVTNAIANGVTDAALTVSGGSPQFGTVAANNSLHWAGVSISPGAGGTATMRISGVRGDASELSVGTTAQSTPQLSVTGQIDAGPAVAISAALQTMATAAATLKFTRSQANPPGGGAQTTVPVVFQETAAAVFHANSTRLRVVLTNLPATVQVFAPVNPSEGATRAQLYSADANGAGGSAIAGTLMNGALYQQLTPVQGTATATWVVLSVDAAGIDTFTFPLLIQNAAVADLNRIQVAGSLAPVSAVAVASATAPVPRYRDFSVPQRLVNLRVSTSVTGSPVSHAVVVGPHASVSVGSNVTFTCQLVNDTSDPTQAATNVVVRDNLPSGLNLVSCTATGSGTCGGSGGQVQVNYSNVAAGETDTVTIVAQISASVGSGSVVENPVSAASDEVNLDLMASSSSASLIVLPGSPVVVGGSPPSGAGASQTFTFQFSDPNGYQNLGVVNVLINNFLDGRHACYLAYVVPTSTLYLVDDAGDAGGPFAGSISLGSSNTIQNSQCSVSLISATGSGTTLSLQLNIAFAPGFGGNRITYVAARDQGTGNSNWQPLGVWQAPFNPSVAISVTSVTPARSAPSSGTSQQFQFVLTDSKGTGDFGIVNVLINSFIDGRQGCYLAYSNPGHALYLVDDSGDAGGPFAGSTVLNGTAGTIQNSQCAVTSGTAVATSAATLTLTLTVTFKAPFAGNRVVYVAGRDTADGNNTGWQAMGTVTVQ